MLMDVSEASMFAVMRPLSLSTVIDCGTALVAYGFVCTHVAVLLH